MSEFDRLASLVDELSEELPASRPCDRLEVEWLEAMRRLAREDAAAAVCPHPDDHLERFVASLVPTLTLPFVVYGAGAVGRRIAALLRTHHRRPAAFVESSRLNDDAVDGLPVWTPQQAEAAGIRDVVLGTLSSADGMRAVLAETYREDFGALRCLCPVEFARPLDPGRLDAHLDEALAVVGRGRTLAEYLWLRRHADERLDAAVAVNRAARRIFHLDRYRFAAAFAADRRVLDCASGTGYGSGWLGRHASPAQVLGVELDAAAVAYATRHYGSPRVAFVQADACQLDALADGSRDLIVSFETIEHVGDDVAMLRGFARLLGDAGVLVTSTPNDWPIETSPYHVRSYDAAGFARTLRTWFDDVTLFAHVVPSEKTRGGVVAWQGQSSTEAECLVAVCRTPRRH